jgi:Amidohydrolase family
MCTADNGWFFHEENELGSIETGQLGDLAVLSDDYFDQKKVSDEGIKQLKSVLTVVGGRIVYSDLHWQCLERFFPFQSGSPNSIHYFLSGAELLGAAPLGAAFAG